MGFVWPYQFHASVNGATFTHDRFPIDGVYVKWKYNMDPLLLVYLCECACSLVGIQLYVHILTNYVRNIGSLIKTRTILAVASFTGSPNLYTIEEGYRGSLGRELAYT